MIDNVGLFLCMALGTDHTKEELIVVVVPQERNGP